MARNGSVSSPFQELLERLPAAHTLAASFALGLGASLTLRPDPLLGTVCATLLFGLAVVLERWRLLVLALALGLAGLSWGVVRLDAADKSVLEPMIGTTAQVIAEVTSPPRSGSTRMRMFVRVRAFDGQTVDESAQLEAPLEAGRPRRGDVIAALVRVVAPEDQNENASGRSFDESAYLARNGIQVVLEASWLVRTGRRGGLVGASDRVRRFLAGGMGEGMNANQRALVRGVVLGEDEALDEELLERFRDSGLFHLLAVSGQNVAYVVAGTLLMAWVAGIPRLAGQLLAILAILSYVGAVGWQPSVARAGVVGTLACLAWLASRPSDRWYFLIVGAVVLLAWSPYALLDPGFQLSFAAVAAIFMLVPILERSLAGAPMPRRLMSIIAVASGCGIATAPILWLQFGAIPVWSVLANAMAEPVVAPLLGLGLLTALLAEPLPSAAAGMGWMNGHLADYLAWCARTVGSAPFARIESGWWALTVTLLSAVPFAFLMLGTAARRRRALRVGAAVSMACVGIWLLVRDGETPLGPSPQGLRITVLDVGQGDAILVQGAGSNVLVDQGAPEAHVAGKLRALGVDELDLLVFSHPQRDHLGGAVEVLERFDVHEVLDPGLDVDSRDYDRALSEARARDVKVVLARPGVRFVSGLLDLQVLWPPDAGAAADDPNDRSVVILVSYGDVDVLLTGDAESHVLNALSLDDVEVLKVAHHGSEDDLLPAFLSRIGPRVAVISVGAGNSFGHPTAETLDALESSGAAVFRTDRDGDVTVESRDGRVVRVGTERRSSAE